MKRIFIDGRTGATLDWSAARQEAQGHEQILWMLDLGLFDRLKKPIEDQTQFLSLALSLEHFRDTLWKEFPEQTHSVCLYSGKNPQLSQRDLWVEYIQLLAFRMPDTMKISIEFIMEPLETLLQEAQLLTAERYERLELLTVGGRLKTTPEANLAICLPPMENLDHDPLLEEALIHFTQGNIPFRIIPETHLTMEWDGLDTILVSSAGLTATGRRKLQGFTAADGTIITNPTQGRVLQSQLDPHLPH